MVVSALTGCADDGKPAAERVAEWCSAFDDYINMIRDEVMDANPPLDPTSQEALELEERISSFVEMDVPDPIEEDWELAMPRGVLSPEELHRPERVAAQVRSYEWILGNCELSADLDAELRRDVADAREELGEDAPAPPTTEPESG